MFLLLLLLFLLEIATFFNILNFILTLEAVREAVGSSGDQRHIVRLGAHTVVSGQPPGF